jgi:hypothetical protein
VSVQCFSWTAASGLEPSAVSLELAVAAKVVRAVYCLVAQFRSPTKMECSRAVRLAEGDSEADLHSRLDWSLST